MEETDEGQIIIWIPTVIQVILAKPDEVLGLFRRDDEVADNGIALGDKIIVKSLSP